MQPQYPAQPYPPQYPGHPAAPPGPQYPGQPAYVPPQMYPPQMQYPPQPPMPPAATGTLDEFFDQPGGGAGPSWKFKDRPMGTTYSGIVARPVGSADIRQQSDPSGRPLFFKDGRPKFVMIVPMIMTPTPEFPEGTAGWYVKGQARDELVRAMAEAGAPEGPPEAGAAISVQLVGQRPIPGMSPAYQYRVHYVRPAGGAIPQPVHMTTEYAPVAPAPVQPVPAYAPQPAYAQPAQPVAPQPVYVPAQPAVAQPAAPAAPAQLAPGLSEYQLGLLAQLTGNQG